MFQSHLVGHFGQDGFAGAPEFFDHPMLARQVRIVLRNCGIIDPESVDHYLARDGYTALEKALSMPWADVLEDRKAIGASRPWRSWFPDLAQVARVP